MNQGSLFVGDPGQYRLNLLPKDGFVEYHPEFMSAADSALLMKQLKLSLQWQADQLNIFGKSITTRRKVVVTRYFGH
jgi:hypothetical protein